MNSAADMPLLPDDFITGVANKHNVTKTELEALLLALKDYSGAEIAEKLAISQPAVRKRLGESYRKLGIEGSGNKKIYNLKQKLYAQYQGIQENFTSPKEDWGEAVDVDGFRGRETDIKDLEEWIVGNANDSVRCRLVAVLGMGGIGKTVIAAKVAQEIQSQFDYLIWRSLRNAPPLSEILNQLLRFLPHDAEDYLTVSENNKILLLIDILRKHRCLIILDNVESVLRSSEGKTQEWAGEYEPGYENYGYFFKKVAETSHESCLLITSREKPKEVAVLEGKNLPVKVLQLSSLNLEEAREILLDKGCKCTDEQLEELVKRYSGNPLALKIVGTTVYDLFSNNITEFLREIQEENAVYGDIRSLLETQFNRLSDLEKQVMYRLAIHREYLSLAQLKNDLRTTDVESKILEVVESLLRRSLIEKEANTSRFRQQSVVMEYVNESYIEKVTHEFSEKKNRSLFMPILYYKRDRLIISGKHKND
ncbi:NB-ARC domain-containing protein [Nostoc cycadae]|uniref:Fis family transcriptional regulator n=1 Tax=Nostoc cycadae WK-1 TaxID=1861711 RepID=A0A2H6LHN4_9NOSO|nr:NB-ARC domain-containing protein [Nostoc cycadae]GBE92730.1 Fis family transcriptional regulator [Nostoc cycadae WK-1]